MYSWRGWAFSLLLKWDPFDWSILISEASLRKLKRLFRKYFKVLNWKILIHHLLSSPMDSLQLIVGAEPWAFLRTLQHRSSLSNVRKNKIIKNREKQLPGSWAKTQSWPANNPSRRKCRNTRSPPARSPGRSSLRGPQAAQGSLWSWQLSRGHVSSGTSALPPERWMGSHSRLFGHQ